MNTSLSSVETQELPKSMQIWFIISLLGEKLSFLPRRFSSFGAYQEQYGI